MKYTVKQYEEVVKLLLEKKDVKEMLDLLNNCDVLLQLLVFDQLYSNKQYKILGVFLVNLSNSDELIKLFSKHLGMDFDALINNNDVFKLNSLFKGISNPEQHSFYEELVNRLIKLTGNNIDNLKDIEMDYYSLILDNYEEYFDVIVNMGLASDVYGLITELLTSKDISPILKSNVYNNVLKKYMQFMSYDYTKVFETDEKAFVEVVGLFNELPNDYLKFIFSNECILAVDEEGNSLISDDNIREFIEFVETLIILNKSDAVELKKLLLKLESLKGEETNYFFSKLEESSVYQEIRNNVKIDDDLNGKILLDILNGDDSLEFQTLFKEFAGSKECLDNYDKILEVLYKEVYTGNAQRNLAMILLLALGNKLVKEYDLDLDFVFTNDVMENRLLGSYNIQEDVLYINRYFIYNFIDYKEGFVSGVDTLYHELKHAKQMQHEMKEDKMDYNLVQQIMDKYLSYGHLVSSYYNDNYINISFEVDARAQAYADTMRFFKDNTEMQGIAKKQLMEDVNNLKLRTRMDTFMGNINNYTVVYPMFIENFNVELSSCEAVRDDYKARNESFIPVSGKERVEEFFSEYPSLKHIFYYDEESNTINIYSEEYFLEKLEELKSNTIINNDEIFFIENILYDIRLANSLESKDLDYRLFASEDQEKELELIDEEVVNEIGLPPVRR